MASFSAWLNHVRENAQMIPNHGALEGFDDLDLLDECAVRPASPSRVASLLESAGYTFLATVVVIVLISLLA